MTGLAETPRLLAPSNSRRVGHEGAFLAKIAGRYHLLCAEWMTPDGVPVKWREAHRDIEAHDYGCMAASSDLLFSPCGPRSLALPHAGHNTLFQDKTGGWWSTFFGNSSRAHFKERPAILPIEAVSDALQ